MPNERTPIYANNSGLLPDSYLSTSVTTLTGTQTLTNKTLSGANNTITNIPLTTAVTGILPIANGGTGSATQNFVDLTSNQTSIGGSKTFTQPVTVSRTGASSTLIISGDAGQERRLTIRTGTADRWRLGATVDAETGTGNTGSNFALIAMNDAGSTLYQIYSVVRSTGVTEYGFPIQFKGGGNPGLIVNTLNTTDIAGLTPSDATIIYNFNQARFNFRQAGAWIGLNDYSDGVRVITAAGNVTLTNADHLVVINKTTGATTTVTLPTGSTMPVGKEFVVKDGKGDAATNNITFNVTGGGTIDGQTTQVINTNRGALNFVWVGTEYVLV